jgi:hypothetical protein
LVVALVDLLHLVVEVEMVGILVKINLEMVKLQEELVAPQTGTEGFVQAMALSEE